MGDFVGMPLITCAGHCIGKEPTALGRSAAGDLLLRLTS